LLEISNKIADGIESSIGDFVWDNTHTHTHTYIYIYIYKIFKEVEEGGEILS
jgi:hypothetical protein